MHYRHRLAENHSDAATKRCTDLRTRRTIRCSELRRKRARTDATAHGFGIASRRLRAVRLAGNVSEDGLVPLFTNADYIVCPYEYEDKTLDSTGVFVQVVNALKEVNPDMHAQIFFVPNRIDPRIGTSDEQRMWSDTNDIFSQIGKVTPMVNSRATLKRINTFELLATQREAVKGAFEYMIRRMK